MTGRQIKFALALGGALEELIERAYTSSTGTPSKPAASEDGDAPVATQITTVDTGAAGGLLGQDIAQVPAVQAVEMVTLQAVKRSASDIHLVPTSDSAKVLFRVDGMIQQIAVLPLTLHESMVSRIKVLAEMDISERRRPQDGSFTLKFGEKTVDFRVSAVGMAWGEMMVIRILDRSGGLLTLEDVGLDSSPLHVWRQLLSLPYGMLLVSGPTGSGKTTTLYASVAELVETRGNIMTVEDPVEYRMDTINQIEVNRAAGLDSPRDSSRSCASTPMSSSSVRFATKRPRGPPWTPRSPATLSWHRFIATTRRHPSCGCWTSARSRIWWPRRWWALWPSG